MHEIIILTTTPPDTIEAIAWLKYVLLALLPALTSLLIYIRVQYEQRIKEKNDRIRLQDEHIQNLEDKVLEEYKRVIVIAKDLLEVIKHFEK